MSEVDVYYSDDYAGMRAGSLSFYYGYEKTSCPTHGTDSHCECDAPEWCFVAKKDGEEVSRLTESELTKASGRKFWNPEENLLLGIALFLEAENPKALA